MLFYCGYTWFPNTRPEEVWERVVHQHERGSNAPELIRGWYDFAGGGAGFLIVETDDVRELTSMLRPTSISCRWIFALSPRTSTTRRSSRSGSPWVRWDAWRNRMSPRRWESNPDRPTVLASMHQRSQKSMV